MASFEGLLGRAPRLLELLLVAVTLYRACVFSRPMRSCSSSLWLASPNDGAGASLSGAEDAAHTFLVCWSLWLFEAIAGETAAYSASALGAVL